MRIGARMIGTINMSAAANAYASIRDVYVTLRPSIVGATRA